MTAGSWKVLEMCEECLRTLNFGADDASPPRSRCCFSLVEANFPCGMTIQKDYTDLGSDTSLVGNFLSRSS